MSRTKDMAKTAITSALAFVILALSSFFPSAALSFAALAGLIPAVLVLFSGYGKAFAAYFITGVFGIIFLPDKSAAVLFVLLFGYYSILKQWLERKFPFVFAWVFKLIFANVVFLIVFFCFTEIFLAVVPSVFTIFWVVWLTYLAAFVVYDRASTGWLLFYSRRIRW